MVFRAPVADCRHVAMVIVVRMTRVVLLILCVVTCSADVVPIRFRFVASMNVARKEATAASKIFHTTIILM